MPLKTIYAWAFAGVAAVLWALGVWWFLRVTGRDRRRGEQEHAMKEAMVMSWSEPATLEVMERFPRSAGPALVYAGQAEKRKDYDEALRRFQIAIARDRTEVRGYLGAERALRSGGRFDEAEKLLLQARRRFRSNQEVHADLAWNAFARQDWPEAVRRWEAFRKRFPDVEGGYQRGAEALRKAARDADADALLAEAAARFPAPAPGTAAGL